MSQRKLNLLKKIAIRLCEPNNGMDGCFDKQDYKTLIWAISELEKVKK